MQLTRSLLLMVMLAAGCAEKPGPVAVELGTVAPEAMEEPESAPVQPASSRREGVIGEGTDYASPWVEMSGSQPGPAVLLEAGIHGSEIAGVIALDRLLPRLDVHSGRVVIFPRMNKPAVDAVKRFLEVDLNKVFPGKADSVRYEERLAAEIFAWVGSLEVDVVLTLHESIYLHDGSNPKTYGQTIVYGVKPMPALVQQVLDQLNEELLDPRHRFYPNYAPIPTSSTEQFVENFGVQGFCAETYRGFGLDQRVALQEELVLAFLDQAGVGYQLRDPETATQASGTTSSPNK